MPATNAVPAPTAEPAAIPAPAAPRARPRASAPPAPAPAPSALAATLLTGLALLALAPTSAALAQDRVDVRPIAPGARATEVPPVAGLPTAPPPTPGIGNPGINGADDAMGPPAPERVIPGVEDVGATVDTRWYDLRSDLGGERPWEVVYEIDGRFVRSAGALHAIFPRSTYATNARGGTSAVVPAGTIYAMGRIEDLMPAYVVPPGPDGTVPPAFVTDSRTRPGFSEDAAVRVAAGPGLGTTGRGERAWPLNDSGVDDRTPLGRARLAGGPWSARDEGRGPGSTLPSSPAPSGVSSSTSSVVTLPAIVEDAEYRSRRLRQILDRALASRD